MDDEDSIKLSNMGVDMKNKIREKIVASLMLTSFFFMNTSAVLAMGLDYSPMLRSEQSITSLDVGSDVQIGNANSVVNLSLREADVKQVLRMFADQAGMNIIFSPSVSGTVTMDLVNITLEKALNLVISTTKLSYDIQANTLIIGSGDEEISSSGAKNLILIPVKYVSASSLATFLNSNFFKKGSGITPGVSSKPVVSVNPATNELIIMGTKSDALLAQRIVEQFDKKPSITTFKVNHVTPAEMADLVCSTFLPSVNGNKKSGNTTGGAASIKGAPTGFASSSSSSSSSSRSSSSSSRNSSSSSSSSSGGSSSGGGDGIAVGGGTLACSIDQNMSGGEISALPFKNMSVVYFPTLGTIQIIGGSSSQIEMIRDYIAQNDKKSPQAYLEVQIISLNEDGMKSFSNTWTYLSKNFSFNAANGNTGTYAEHPIFFSGSGYTMDSSKDSNTYSRWGSSSQLTYAMNYILTNRKGRVLANPRVLLTSGQESTIDLSSDYVSKVTSQYLDSTGGGSSQVQRDYDIESDNGINVTITPFISPDGYIVLDIEPEYNTISEKLEDINGDIQATLLARRSLSLKGVRIKDGETLVIGGLIQESETKSVSKIPLLGDLPVVGMFFRSTSTSKAKEEMVIMLTPQILVDTEDAVDNEIAL